MRTHLPSSWSVPLHLHSLLVQAVVFVLRPTAIYRAIELDVPAQWLGALGASFAVVPLLLALPSGRVADRFGERAVMLTGSTVLVGASAAFVAVGDRLWGLVTATVTLGLGHLGTVVSQQTLVANRTHPSRFDTAFGHYTFATSAGQALGPGLIVLFGGGAAIPDTAAIFAWSAGLTSVLLVTAVLVPGSDVARRGGRERATGSVVRLLRLPGAVRALTVSCVVLAALDISLVYLPLLGSERGIPAGVIGAILATRAMASMVSRFFLGRLARRWGRRDLLVTSVVVAAVGVAALPLPVPVWALFVVVGVVGAALGMGQPLTMSWLADATPAGMRGRAMSLRLTGNRMGQVVVPSVAGLVAAGAGAAGVLWLTASTLAAVGFGARRIPPTSAEPEA